MRITLARIGDNKTVRYATEELNRCLKRIDPDLIVDTACFSEYDESIDGVIWVGQDAHFTAAMPEVKDPSLDDAILIDIVKNEGIIAGNNPRATLIAAYRFLREIGCAWVRASEDGEIIPQFAIVDLSCYVVEAASYRHRAICIEGAATSEHLNEMVKWIPRVGMNGYYTQFFLPGEFLRRWYSHYRNPYLADEGYSRETAVGMVQNLEEEIDKRDLLYHSVGHGWTCKPFGFFADGWSQCSSDDIPEDKREYLALVNGKREFWGGVPLNTNLCYSNPEVREKMSDAIVAHCESHPNVKYLHVWLADGSNNNCECEECQKKRPSDFYVMILNEVDRKLTEKGIDTKIVFLVYVDLLWAPETEVLNNPDRFVAMFAPITRTYSKSFKNESVSEEPLPPYVRNKLVMPSGTAENAAHLKEWLEKTGARDSFDFDYHLMWDHMRDMGYFNIAKVLFDDMQNLDKISLNGMVSCQITRAAFPTGLPMQMMADALWDKECDFEEKSDEYFISAFGSDGIAVKEYMRTISDGFDIVYLREHQKPVSEEYAARLRTLYSAIVDFDTVIENNLARIPAGNMRKSWEYLKYHSAYVKRFHNALLLCAEGKDFAAAKEEFCRYAFECETKLHRVLDPLYSEQAANATFGGEL